MVGLEDVFHSRGMHTDQLLYLVQAAMVDWVENGKAVDYLVAIKYNISRNELSADFASTRKLCPVSCICSLPKLTLILHDVSSIRRGRSISALSQTRTRRFNVYDRSGRSVMSPGSYICIGIMKRLITTADRCA